MDARARADLELVTSSLRTKLGPFYRGPHPPPPNTAEHPGPSYPPPPVPPRPTTSSPPRRYAQLSACCPPRSPWPSIAAANNIDGSFWRPPVLAMSQLPLPPLPPNPPPNHCPTGVLHCRCHRIQARHYLPPRDPLHRAATHGIGRVPLPPTAHARNCDGAELRKLGTASASSSSSGSPPVSSSEPAAAGLARPGEETERGCVTGPLARPEAGRVVV